MKRPPRPSALRALPPLTRRLRWLALTIAWARRYPAPRAPRPF